MATFTNLISAIVTGSANVDDADFRTWGGELEGYAVGFEIADKSTGYTVLAADRGKLIRGTATLTLTLTAAATIGAGYMVAVKADGGTVTVDPNGAELINGASSLVLADGAWALIYCTGTAWRALVTGTSGIADLIDEDDMATDSASRPPSQQSAKAYTDAHGLVQRVYSSTATASTTTATIPVDDTLPQNTEGVELLTANITPTSASNRLRIRAQVNAANSGNNKFLAALFAGAGVDAVSAMADTFRSGNTLQQYTIEHEMAAGTTSAVTVALRVGTNIGTLTINGESGSRIFGGALISSLTVDEVKA